VFVLIASLTADLRAQIDHVVRNYDTDLLIQSRRAATPLQSRITPADLEALRQRLGANVSPLLLDAVREPWSPYALLIGMPQELIPRMPLAAGRGLVPGSGQVLLGTLAASQLGLSAGDTMVLGGVPRSIAGVFRTGNRLLDGASVMDLDDAWQILGREGRTAYYNLLVVHGLGEGDVGQLVVELTAEFPQLRATTGSEFAGSLQTFRSVRAITGAIGLVALLGGALVLVNTLLIALSERTWEIGVLMSIGWRPGRVLRLLLAESLILCLTGSLLGNLIALGLLRWLATAGSFWLGLVPVQVNAQAFVASLLVSVVIAVAALVWPAAVVLRVRPAEALRHG
jgi:putative ABC transport system permease protein